MVFRLRPTQSERVLWAVCARVLCESYHENRIAGTSWCRGTQSNRRETAETKASGVWCVCSGGRGGALSRE
eukprot:3531605-Rhodomonas_salina.1